MSDYHDAGFDSFLSRSIDDTPQQTLDSQGPTTTQIRYDSAGITGALGDSIRLGRIYLNGSSGTIVMNDGTNDVLLIGEDGS